MARIAVVIGSNGPEDAGALRYAKKDALRIAQTLGHPRCGFDVIRPTNLREPKVVEARIEEAAERCREGDTFVLFFSGHGYSEGNGLQLMLDRTSLAQPLSTALHADSLVRAMRFCRAQHKVLILDCCHAGEAVTEGRFKSLVGTKITRLVSGDDPDSESFVAVIASGRFEKAREFDSLKGSFLAEAIVEALGDSFEDADADRDGAIDLDDLMRWLQQRARHHNRKNPTDRVPVPISYGQRRGQLFITRSPGEWETHRFRLPNGLPFVALPFRAPRGAAWLIGETPITNAQYARFVQATGHRIPEGEHIRGKGPKRGWRGPFRPWDDPDFGGAEKPVVCVDFHDALAFGKWASQDSEFPGLGLVPTGVWDLAAFGSPYPTFDPRVWGQSTIHQKATSPADCTNASGRANRVGAIDLFGNVWEWTHSGEESWSSVTAPPTGEAYRKWQLRNQQLRGGSFLDDLNEIRPAIAAGALSDATSTRHSDLGFRLGGYLLLDQLPSDIAHRLELSQMHELNAFNVPVTA